MANDDELGPLPRADANSTLQRQSLKALDRALPSDRFVLRDERVDDYGVDVSLEVLVETQATNCRAQVQVKGRSSLKPNGDGSFSVSVDASNLNYILNGPCPLYVLYRPETEELLFAFAVDEHKRIAELDDSWRTKNSLTIRFHKKLDTAALEEISRRAIDEARRHRTIRDELAAVEPGSRTRIEFDTKTGPAHIVRAEDARILLLRDGMKLVSWGFASRVVEIAALLSGDELRRDPRLQLVVGYAHFYNGSYLDADARLRHAYAQRSQLDAEDGHFLAYLMNAIQLAFGEISSEEFRERSDAWRESAPEILQLQYDVLRMWTRQSEALSPQEAEQLLLDVQQLLRDLEQRADAPQGVQDHARLLLAFQEIRDRALKLGQALLVTGDPQVSQLIYGKPPPEVLEEELGLLAAWRNRLRTLINAIRETGNASLYCQALATRDMGEVYIISQLYIVASVKGTKLPEVPKELFDQLRATQVAATHFHQPEIELRSRLLEAELFDLVGDRAGAVKLANEVRHVAESLRRADIVRTADILTSSSRHEDRQREIASLHKDGVETFFARMTDDDLDDYSRTACAYLGLPDDRIDIARDGAECQRAFARAQLDWCRQLTVLEDDSHEATSETLYTRKPERVVRCALLGSQSLIPSNDWSAVLAAFKVAHCNGCSHRSPRGASS